MGLLESHGFITWHVGWSTLTNRGESARGSLQTKWALKKRAKLQCGCLVGFLALIPPNFEIWSKILQIWHKFGGFKKKEHLLSDSKPCNVSMQKKKTSQFQKPLEIIRKILNKNREKLHHSNQTLHSRPPLHQIPPPHSFPRSQKNKMETKNTAHHDDTAVPGQSLWIGTLAKLMGGVLRWCYFNDGPMTYFGSC